MTAPEFDPREIAAEIGRLTGRDEVAQTVISGRLSAKETIPFVAGLVAGLMKQAVIPTIGATGFEEGLHSETGAYRALLRVADGSKLQVTIEAVS